MSVSRDVLADAPEDFELSVVEQGDAVGDVILEACRAVFELAEGNELAAARDLEPLHVARQALETVRARREKDPAAVLAAGAVNLAFFQVVDKIVGFGQ